MTFQISIKKRIAEVLSTDGNLPILVCDNADHTLAFSFDEEWMAYDEKTARFVYRENGGKGNTVYIDVPFTGDTVSVPLLHNITEVWIGVYAGDLITSSAARLSCIASVFAFSADSALAVGSEDVTVTLALASGDQTVTPSDGKTISSAVIRKPTTLLPRNIRYGVNIAGVVGTYAPEDNGVTIYAPTISLSGNVLTIMPVGSNVESYEIYAGGDYAGTTSSTTLNLASMLSYLEDGAYTVWVLACSDTLGLKSEKSNTVSYTVSNTSLGAPTISLSGDILSITAGSGNAENYEIYAGGDYAGTTVASSVALSSMLSYLETGTYTVWVVACNDTTGVKSAKSNIVTYTVANTSSSESDAPSISLLGDTLTITSNSDEYDSYEVYAGGDYAATTTLLSVDLSDMLSYLDEGTYTVWVVACSNVTGEKSDQSNTVNYTVSTTSTSYSLSIQDTSTLGKLFSYGLNMDLNTMADGGYTDNWDSSSSLRITGLNADDQVLLVLWDTDFTFSIVSAIGCTCGSVQNSSFGANVTISNFTGAAALKITAKII